MSQITAKLVCAEFWVEGKTYHTQLPEELKSWYAYCFDGGHSIVCCLKSDFLPFEDLTDYLLPVPVKAVLKGYEIHDKYVVVDLPYDSAIGLIVPASDTEL